MDSVGAGAGSFVRLDPYSGAIKLGPDSAGYRVGTCWPESGLDTVSVSDCHVVLGYLNPDNFLGGAIQLDVERARQHIQAQIADPLGLSVEDAAAGVIELLDLQLREYLRSNVSAKGYSPTDFVCFSYGGAGPVHTYGYTEGLGFKDVVVPAWAAGFSAFGCACADFESLFGSVSFLFNDFCLINEIGLGRFFSKGHLLFDLIYNPAETEFLKRGRLQNAQTKNGLEMLHLPKHPSPR